MLTSSRYHLPSRWTVGAWLAFASATLPAAAFAESPKSNERAADAAFEEGRSLLAQGKLGEACAKLAESDRLAPSGRAVLNLADCFERRGMLVNAHSKFLEAAVRAVDAHRPDAEHHARERASNLATRLARLAFVIPKESEASGIQVQLDGKPLDTEAAIEPVDPGTPHTFDATAAGGKTFHATVIAQEGRTTRVELNWSEATPHVVVMPKDEGTPTHPVDGDLSSLRPLAFGSLGLGVVGIGVGIFAGLKILDSKNTVDKSCHNGVCETQEGLDAASSGKTYSIIAPIAFGVGVLGAGLGTYLLVKSSRSSPKTAFLPSVSPTGFSLSARTTF
jgi:hypothetical protein